MKDTETETTAIIVTSVEAQTERDRNRNGGILIDLSPGRHSFYCASSNVKET